MNKQLEENYKWVISCYDYKCKNLQEKVEQLENKLECYQLQEKEYIDFIEGQQKEIETLKNGNLKLKSQKEEIEKSKEELRKLQSKSIELKDLEIEELEKKVNNLLSLINDYKKVLFNN